MMAGPAQYTLLVLALTKRLVVSKEIINEKTISGDRVRINQNPKLWGGEDTH